MGTYLRNFLWQVLRDLIWKSFLKFEFVKHPFHDSVTGRIISTRKTAFDKYVLSSNNICPNKHIRHVWLLLKINRGGFYKLYINRHWTVKWTNIYLPLISFSSYRHCKWAHDEQSKDCFVFLKILVNILYSGHWLSSASVSHLLG